MIQEEIVEGDLLYHAVHGICRVDEVNKQKESGKQVLRYSLVPNTANRMKARFIITASDMKISGFHELVSVKEANKILDYLKVGPSATDSSSNRKNQIWDMARAILTFAHEKFEAQDQRKRQTLERSARGLIGELAYVFKISLKEAAEKVQKSLGKPSKVNPSVLVALLHAGED